MKSRYLIIFLILVNCSLQSLAQNHVIDSLRKAIKTESNDTNKVKTLNALSNCFRVLKPDTMLSIAKQAVVLAEKLGWNKGIASASNNVGTGYREKGDYPNALANYQRTLKIAEEIGNKMLQSAAFGNMGIVYKSQGNYPNAINYDLKALKIDEELGDKSGQAINFGSMGVVYRAQGDYPNAIDCDLKALKINEEMGNKQGQALNLCYIGNVYKDEGNYDTALYYDIRSLKMSEEIGYKMVQASDLCNIGIIYCERNNYSNAIDYDLKALKMAEEIGNRQMQATILGNIGIAYKDIGNYQDGLNYDQQALKLSEELGDKQGQGLNIGNIGAIYITTGKYKDAEESLKRAITIDSTIGDQNNLRIFYELISQLYDTLGRYKLSLFSYKKAMILKDTLFSMDKDKALTRKEVTYQYEKKETAEREEQMRKEATAEQERNRQKVIRNSFIGGFALMLALAFFIFRGYTQKQKANVIITRQKEEVEKQKMLVEEKNKDITDSINYAKRIQRALLKEEEYVSKHLPEHFILFKPKDIVSGDFYWAVEKEEYFYFAAVDCTGHGVPGGFMSMLGLSFLNEITKASAIETPAEILDELRTKILTEFKQKEGEDQTKDGMDISLMRMNLKTNEIQWSGANNPLYIIGDQLEEIPPDKQPIGYFPVMKPFTNHIIKAEKGSILYLFSDGYADQFGGPKAKKFRHSQFKEVLLSIHKKKLKEQKKSLNEIFENWKGNLEQVDDILVIGIKV